MTARVQLKVCGLTRLADAEFAAASGADYLGFIVHPKSPRHLPLDQFRAFSAQLPQKPKVAVTVEPTLAELASYLEAGFDFFQIHFSRELPLARVEEWSKVLGSQRLWLAPKLPPEYDVSAAWLPLAQTFMLDTFQADRFGGSGKTGDWPKFARHQRVNREKTWILAGGLNPGNVREAIEQSGARFIDVNSGVEASPGLKDHAKLAALAATLREG
jgi:phosphoribosylanthranilate isomerase